MDAYYAVWNWKDNQRVDGTSMYNFKFSISIHVLFLLQLDWMANKHLLINMYLGNIAVLKHRGLVSLLVVLLQMGIP
ncbi:Glutamate:proton symporter [Phytophthora palmivora]|uniref:Glutamate:proton symporter n=1 Tax=Phytophthora palmivora TaxID=4796 RepID=A0A2P4XGT0_9STRA|nr:Glutamate:proton symporter [Phytophthora palmivora]